MNKLSWGAALSLIGALGVTSAAVAADPLPPGPGRNIVVSKCSACHATVVVAGERHDADGWNEVVDKMVDRGLEISEAERDSAVAYLAKVFPPAASAATKPPAKR